MKSAKNFQMTLITLVGLLVLPLSLNAQTNQVRRLYTYQPVSLESISEFTSLKANRYEARDLAVIFEDWMDKIHYLDVAAIEIESWMLDASYIQTDQSTIQMEDWMQNPNYLQDEKIDLAPWMCDPAYLQKGKTI